MKRKLILPLLLLSLYACSTSNETTLDPQPEVGELIEIQIGAGEATTRVSYEPNSDNSEFTFSWEAGDEVSVVVPGTSNANQKFVAATTGASTTLNGEIATWSGEQTLYAIYPYSASGYTLDSSAQTIFFDNTSQTIDVTSGVSYENGLMVVAVDGATAASEADYNVPNLKFTQVMSHFKLDLVDIPEGEQCTSISFEADADLFVATADIDLTTGDITPRTYSSRVSATVESYSGNSASFNFALLPVDLSGNDITLNVTTTSDTDINTYTYQIDGGLNFSANSFLYSENGELTLQDDFTESNTESEMLYLADFNSGYTPTANTWIICDSEATTESFAGLRSVLESLWTEKEVALEFPNLKAIPEMAICENGSSLFRSLSSISAPVALTIGEYAFGYCWSLSEVDFPEVTTIEDMAFYDCNNLQSVIFPEATTIGEYAFSTCNSLLTAEFPQAITIGENAFRNCTSLDYITAGEATTIGDGAFALCSSLPILVDFPKVTTIGESAFSGCTALQAVEFPEATTIGSLAFSSCGLKTIYFPKLITIGAYAFISCTELQAVEFPEVTTIEYMAFGDCTALRTVEFPEVTTIEDMAFIGCTELLYVSLATNEGVVLSSPLFYYIDSLNWISVFDNPESITLTLGLSNKSNVVGNTITISGQSCTFYEIIILGDWQPSLLASASNGIGISW